MSVDDFARGRKKHAAGCPFHEAILGAVRGDDGAAAGRCRRRAGHSHIRRGAAERKRDIRIIQEDDHHGGRHGRGRADFRHVRRGGGGGAGGHLRLSRMVLLAVDLSRRQGHAHGSVPQIHGSVDL